MAFTLNKIQLIGNLGRDVETRFTTSNVSISNFAVATTYSYKGKDGNWVEETTWHNVVAFNLSDFMKDHLKKGKKVYVEGRLTKREYSDKDGNKRHVIEVVAEKIIPLENNTNYNDSPATTKQEELESSPVEDDLPF